MERDPENYQSVEMVSGILLFTISHLVGAGGSPVQWPESGFRENQRQYLALQCSMKLELSASGCCGHQDNKIGSKIVNLWLLNTTPTWCLGDLLDAGGI